jgi:hypothetical protein
VERSSGDAGGQEIVPGKARFDVHCEAHDDVARRGNILVY